MLYISTSIHVHIYHSLFILSHFTLSRDSPCAIAKKLCC